MRIRDMMKVGILGAAATLTFGCASNAEMNEMAMMKTEIQNAMDMANQANAKADEALRRADEANSCCQANEDKINRMFQRSMMK